MQNPAALSISPALGRQQRAIHHALCLILTEAEAECALQTWMEQYSANGSVFSGLNNYAREICTAYAQEGRHRELVQAINRALIVFKESDLRPLPTAALSHPGWVAEAVAELISSAEGEPSQQISTPEFETFRCVLRVLLNGLDQFQVATGAACRAFLFDVIENLPWSPAQQKQVVDILHGLEPQQTRPYRPGQLKNLTQHLTVWLKENLPPDDSLGIINHAISESRETAAGKEYSPKQFFVA
jgi:hypothetical protein